MFREARFVVVLAVVGCGGEGDADHNASPATVTEAPAESRGSTMNARTPDWSVTYSGDLSGEFSGRLFVVTGTDSTTSFAAGNPRRPPAISGTLRIAEGETGAAGLSMFSMILEDGSECESVDVRGEVVSATEEGYEITLSGNVDCGGKAVSIEGRGVDD